MHSDHFSWKSKQLLPPCTYHTCEIATCRLKLWAPLVASNTNDDDKDDDGDDNNNSLLTEYFVAGIIHPQIKPEFSPFLFLMNN